MNEKNEIENKSTSFMQSFRFWWRFYFLNLLLSENLYTRFHWEARLRISICFIIYLSHQKKQNYGIPCFFCTKPLHLLSALIWQHKSYKTEFCVWSPLKTCDTTLQMFTSNFDTHLRVLTHHNFVSNCAYFRLDKSFLHKDNHKKYSTWT